MTIPNTQNAFSFGEIDPALLARNDLELYTKGARKLRNLVALWTGSATLRPGTTCATESGDPFYFIDRTNSNAPITDPDEINIVMYEYAPDTTYTVCFVADTTSNVAIEIFLAGVHQTTIAGSISATNVWQTAWIPDLKFEVGQDRILIFYESRQTTQLIRGASHTSWTLSWFQPSVYPTFDFTTVNTSENQYRRSGVTFTPSATSGTGITVTAAASSGSADFFNDNHVGGLFQSFSSTNSGEVRITAVNAAGTVATGDVTKNFSAAAAIAGVECSVREVMWSPSISNPPPSVNAGTDRGWPAVGAFFNNRLMAGRSASLKNTGAASELNIFNNFDDSDLDSSTGFQFQFNGQGQQVLQDIISDDALLFLCSNRTFSTNPLTETAITPSNFYAPPQGQNSVGNIRAVTLDNQILHVTKNGTQVNSVVYRTAEAKYKAEPANLLSNHLVGSINSNAGWLPPGVNAKLYLATQDDGTLLVFNSLEKQGVSAWSLNDTTGQFRQVAAVSDLCDLVVQRKYSTGSTIADDLQKVYRARDEGTPPENKLVFEDVTDLFNLSGTNLGLFNNQLDMMIFGMEMPFTRLDFTLAVNANPQIDYDFEYLNVNGNWQAFTPTDNTSGFTTSGSIVWTFTDVADWRPQELNGVENYFWMRIVRTANSLTTVPEQDDGTVNTGTRIYLERLSFDDYMDSIVDTTSNSTGAVTNLFNLAGHQVYAIANGNTTGPFFVDDMGDTNIEEQFGAVEIGIKYNPLLRPMPVYTPTQEGGNIYKQKHVRELYIDYVNSLYLEYDKETFAELELNNYTLGQSTPPQTRYRKITARGSWEPREIYDIKQSKPGPMTIIGIGYHVEVT